jgi:hypothetical protein
VIVVDELAQVGKLEVRHQNAAGSFWTLQTAVKRSVLFAGSDCHLKGRGIDWCLPVFQTTGRPPGAMRTDVWHYDNFATNGLSDYFSAVHLRNIICINLKPTRATNVAGNPSSASVIQVQTKPKFRQSLLQFNSTAPCLFHQGKSPLRILKSQ